MSETGWGYDEVAKTYRPPVGVGAHSHQSADLPSAGSTPVGGVIAFYGATAPANWLTCDGGTFSAVTYPALSVVLGGTTLPNLKGKVIVGVDGADTDFDVVGETGGAKTVTIASGNLPTHTHGLNSHTHSGTTDDENSNHQHAVTGGTAGHSNNHAHTVGAADNAGLPDLQGWPASNVHNSFRTSDHGKAGGGLKTDGVDADHTHTFSTTADPTGTSHDHNIPGDSGSTTNGGFANTAVNKVQPYMALSYIIRAA